MASDAVIELTNENFEAEVLNSDIPVIVDFWAVWCQPCLMVAQYVDELAERHAGQVKVGKVNTEEAQELAIKYQIMSIPTIMLFKGGEKVAQIVGARHSADDLARDLKLEEAMA